MRRDANTILLTIAIFGVAVYLQGCSALPEQKVEAVQPTHPVPAPIVETVPITEVGDLVRQLDTAGCDFAGVRITRATVRKGSGTMEVRCK